MSDESYIYSFQVALFVGGFSECKQPPSRSGDTSSTASKAGVDIGRGSN